MKYFALYETFKYLPLEKYDIFNIFYIFKGGN